MDLLAVVGLVSSIVTFLDVGSKLCVTANQLYKDGQTANDRECSIILDDLREVCRVLEASTTATSGAPYTSNGVNQRIAILASRCLGLAQPLSAKLQALAVPPGSSRGAAFKKALKRMWNRNEINEAAQQLREYRHELAFNILTDLPTHNQLLSAIGMNLRPLENSISAVESRLSTIMPGVEAGLLAFTTKMDHLDKSQQSVQLTIQSLNRQGVEHHNKVLNELKAIGSQNTSQHEKIISHLREQVTELEQVVRSLREQQFFHVSGNQNSLTACMVANSDATAPGIIFTNFLKTAQSAIHEFFARHRQGSSVAGRGLITQAEAKALEFTTRNLSECMDKESMNVHHATFSWAAVVDAPGFGTAILRVTSQKQSPRCHRRSRLQKTRTALKASLKLITSRDLIPHGLNFNYCYSLDPRGLPSLVQGVRLFNVLPQNDATFVHQYDLGRVCSREMVLVLLRHWSQVEDLFEGSETCRCCYGATPIDEIMDLSSRERVDQQFDTGDWECRTETDIGKLLMGAPLIWALFEYFPRNYTPFDRDEDGQTILHFAASGDPEEAYTACSFLIDLGAEKDAWTRDGALAFHTALGQLVFRIKETKDGGVLTTLMSNSEKLLRLLWADTFEPPDTTICAIFDALRGISEIEYTSKRPLIQGVLRLITRLGGFADWHGYFAVTWFWGFSDWSRTGSPKKSEDRSFLMSFLTDVFDCFPPGREILSQVIMHINMLRYKNLLPPDFLTEPGFLLYGRCGHLRFSPVTFSPWFEPCDNHRDSIATTTSSIDDLRGRQLFVGIIELLRICIRVGVDIYVSQDGMSSVLDSFYLYGLGGTWRALVEKEAGIDQEYVKKSIEIRWACHRRRDEMELREVENLKRREEIQKWKEQDKEREQKERQRMEEESLWYSFPTATSFATAMSSTPWLLDEDQQAMEEARARWAAEDHQREAENEERKEARLRWGRENERRLEEDRRRKQEERSWNFVVGNRDQSCACL
ncbi:hypothetical protein QBC37DRAFT_430422 [Rhypophila decipiens]|uniref:Fungal N-terminal domain-containing protein n=1 Tax=Rhypophila decipiens TaxID=261697 RepID=A0AAN7B607_9PEZI|nr:hypothetical protein QBC37DRAFT_430422 [Rhypophila decipiens]